MLRVAPFRPLRAALVQTKLPGLKAALIEKTAEVTRAKLGEMGAELAGDAVCEHDAKSISATIAASAASGVDVVLVLGASAIVDRRDVVPTAIEALGGTLVHFGMPVDPGNLLMLGYLEGTPVLGAPGCARSPKLNIVDFLLPRLLLGERLAREDIASLGHGGLLEDVPERPMPRERAVGRE